MDHATPKMVHLQHADIHQDRCFSRGRLEQKLEESEIREVGIRQMKQQAFFLGGLDRQRGMMKQAVDPSSKGSTHILLMGQNPISKRHFYLFWGCVLQQKIKKKPVSTFYDR